MNKLNATPRAEGSDPRPPGAAVHLTRTGSAITLELDRPDKRNALDVTMSDGILRALDTAADIPLPLVIRSRHRGMFVAGADVNQLRRRTIQETLARRNARLFQQVEEHPWPTVALVEGAALGGGCELAIACDFRVTTPDAQWGLPETRLGILPSAGGLTRLGALVGSGAATDLVMTGRRIDGETAGRWGLAQRVAGQDCIDGALDTLLDELGMASPLAVRLAKEAMRATGDRHRLVDAASQALCLTSDDTQQRLARLVERRADPS